MTRSGGRPAPSPGTRLYPASHSDFATLPFSDNEHKKGTLEPQKYLGEHTLL
jgi:hypothetical protein